MSDRSTPVYDSGEADRLPVHDHEVYNAIMKGKPVSFSRIRDRGGAVSHEKPPSQDPAQDHSPHWSDREAQLCGV